jgi:hypothetical protein
MKLLRRERMWHTKTYLISRKLNSEKEALEKEIIEINKENVTKEENRVVINNEMKIYEEKLLKLNNKKVEEKIIQTDANKE